MITTKNLKQRIFLAGPGEFDLGVILFPHSTPGTPPETFVKDRQFRHQWCLSLLAGFYEI